MALLLKDREATPGTAQPPPDGGVSATAPDFACEACGAAMARGQDWCLECGTAAPGRLGARPGWRAAFSVVGATTALLLCAVVAAYAALTGDAERSASTPPLGSADPITAQTPGAVAPATAAPGAVAVQPGATGPNTAAPPAVANTTPIIPAKPPGPVTNIPVKPPPAATNSADSATGSTGSTGSTDSSDSTDSAGSTGTSSASASAGPAAIALAKDAARTYNQPARAGAEFGPARYAIDDKPGTVWDVVVPADGQPIAAGLVLDLGKPHALRSLRLATTTPGFTVEIYGAKSAKELPADVIDKRWIHLTDKKAVEDGTLINLKGKGDNAKVQLVLLHFTTPGNLSDPRVAIGDVALRGTP